MVSERVAALGGVLLEGGGTGFVIGGQPRQDFFQGESGGLSPQTRSQEQKHNSDLSQSPGLLCGASIGRYRASFTHDSGVRQPPIRSPGFLARIGFRSPFELHRYDLVWAIIP